jgi:Uma2 family endonuclease
VACTITGRGPKIIVPPSAHTLAGFRAWAVSDDFPERGRISFIGREIFIDMSPEELSTHSLIKVEIGYALVKLNKRLKVGVFCPDKTLITNVRARVSTEPNASFVTWESLESGRVRRIPMKGQPEKSKELAGTPDWVLEIVSDSSVRKDTRRLRERYYRAGIPEYWLIDARGEEIQFQILIRGETAYVEAPGQGGWQSSPLFGRQFRLVRRRGRLGLWEYTLQVKSPKAR